MFSPSSRFSKIVSIFALAAFALTVLPPAPVAAETSYKRLKRKLRAVEWHVGEVLKATGAVTVVILDEIHFLEGPVSVDIDFEEDRPEPLRGSPPAKPAKPKANKDKPADTPKIPAAVTNLRPAKP